MMARLAGLLTGLITLAGGMLAAAAAEKVSLRLDWVNSGYHAIWYYGVDAGIFQRAGIALAVRGHGLGHVRHRRYFRRNGPHLAGTSDQSRRRLSAPKPARHHLSHQQG